MGRRPVNKPISFMPSDSRFLGARDLQGLPVGPCGERMPIHIISVDEVDAGERINGKTMSSFWAMVFDIPVNEWLLHPWPKPAIQWRRSRKEWKLGPTVVGRISLRLGMHPDEWKGRILPLRMEETTFGREWKHCVRPVPMPWESDKRMVQRAYAAIAAGAWEPNEDEPPAEDAYQYEPVPPADDVHSDPDHERWLAECAQDCTCCRCCQQVPCGGITAGGFCDGLGCVKTDDEPPDDAELSVPMEAPND